MNLNFKRITLVFVYIFLCCSIGISHAGKHEKHKKHKKHKNDEEHSAYSDSDFQEVVKKKELSDGTLRITLIPKPTQNATSILRVYLTPNPRESYMELDLYHDSRNTRKEYRTVIGDLYGFYGEEFIGYGIYTTDKHHEVPYIKYDHDQLYLFASTIKENRINKYGYITLNFAKRHNIFDNDTLERRDFRFNSHKESNEFVDDILKHLAKGK